MRCYLYRVYIADILPLFLLPPAIATATSYCYCHLLTPVSIATSIGPISLSEEETFLVAIGLTQYLVHQQSCESSATNGAHIENFINGDAGRMQISHTAAC